jgi:23S rRNA (adenine2503-C2)-methyltransferase
VKCDVKSQTLEELQEQFQKWECPTYRVTQLLDWLYRRKVTSWEEMTNLPKNIRQNLEHAFSLETLQLARKQGSRDTTQKFLWRLSDGAFIESVLIPANPALYGEASDRHTLCVSTQVGCAYGCRFCASGLEGWKRNLGAHEIVEQVLAVERWALKILNAPWGGGIGARKITVSTSGLAPQIRKLADEPFQFRLAISLHGATDEVRSKIMPINRKYPVSELAAACEYYQSKKGKMITLEYILIKGVNDGIDQIKPLAELAGRLNAKVNLIPYNKVEGLPWERPDEAAQDRFANALSARGVIATLRREKGHDIDAACGQLRLKTERELAEAAAAVA